jgi:hypothetical protein
LLPAAVTSDNDCEEPFPETEEMAGQFILAANNPVLLVPRRV